MKNSEIRRVYPAIQRNREHINNLYIMPQDYNSGFLN
jgi:hypothetical protein